jgi:hypothetical protein
VAVRVGPQSLAPKVSRRKHRRELLRRHFCLLQSPRDGFPVSQFLHRRVSHESFDLWRRQTPTVGILAGRAGHQSAGDVVPVAPTILDRMTGG